MIKIFHGNDISASRTEFINLRNITKDSLILDGNTLTYDSLFQTLEGNSLFLEEKNIFIENFFGSKKSNSLDFKKIIDYINDKSETNLFFWEGKELTKAQTGLIKKAEVKQYSYPQILFNFLDNIKPKNLTNIRLFKDLQKQMEEEIILYMIIRQFRLMLGLDLESEIDEAKRMAPWQRSKIERQARLFTRQELFKAYKNIYKIDYETKFGLSPLSLDKRIDIFLASL